MCRVAHWRILSVLGLWFLGFFSDLPAEASDWKLKRTDREQVITQRLMRTLRKDPFSAYAFRRLLSVHKKRVQRAALIREYRRLIAKQPKALAPKIVLARILVFEKKWAGALRLYEIVSRQTPKALQPLLQRALCLQKLHKYELAAKLYRSVLPRLKGKKRRMMLRRLLLADLKDGNSSGVDKTLRLFKKERWKKGSYLRFARMLREHRYKERSYPLYQRALRETRSTKARVQLLLEMSRHALADKKPDDTMRWIQRARKAGGNQSWLKKELLALEVEAFRQKKQLPKLLKRLEARWKRSRDFSHIMMLGQLHHELKQFAKARAYYRKALKVRPSAREPRLRLITWHFQKRQDAKARKHMRALIKYKQAEPKHYIQLAQFLLKSSGRPAVIRWKTEWAYIYSTDGSFVRQFAKQSEHPKVQAMVFCRGRRDNWDECRERKWKFWERYEANDAKRKMVKEGLRLLASCMKRNPRHWDSLQQVERLSDQYGYPKVSKEAFRRLLKATGDEVRQLEAMLRLLRRRGREGELMLLFRRMMRPRAIAPKRAEILADFVYRTLSEQLLLTELGRLSASQRRRKRRQACSLVRRFLTRPVRSLSYRQAKARPLMVARMSALFLSCGGRSGKARSLFRRAERQMVSSAEGRERLLDLCVNYQYSWGFKRSVSTMARRRKLESLLSFLRFKLDDGPFAHTSFVLKHLKGRSRKYTSILARVIRVLCRQKESCRETENALNSLVRNRRTPAPELFNAISASAQHQLFVKKRIRWLDRLYKRYRRKQKTLSMLVLQRNSFLDPSLDTQLARKLILLHRSILLRVLSLLRKTPRSHKAWSGLFAYHLRELASIKPSKRAPTLKRFERYTMRFAPLYRGLLRAYLQIDAYHKRGARALQAWLKKSHTLQDLRLLTWLPRIDDTTQKKSFLNLAKRLRNPKELRWMADFMHQRGMLRAELEALAMLRKARRRDLKLLKRHALLLDQLPGQEKQADALWFQWLARNPDQTSLSNLRSFARQCCQNEEERLMAGRLLSVGFRKHNNRKVEPIFKRIIDRLQPKQRQRLVARLSQRRGLSHAFLEELADLAFRYNVDDVTISLYKSLLQRKKKPLYQQRLGILLDHTGRFRQASPYWKALLKSRSKGAKIRFYTTLAKRLMREDKERAARLSMYRAVSHKPRAAESHSRIRQLRAQGKDLLAWAHWMHSQKDKAAHCLNTNASQHPHTFASAKRLWSFGIPHQGPLLFFAPCTWNLPAHTHKQLLPTLRKYLKQDNRSLLVAASASPQEPDSRFLSQQRAHTLQLALARLGIPKRRIRIASLSSSQLCSSRAKTKDCNAYQRQLAIGTQAVPHTQYVTRDADHDGVPDFIDQCPIQAGHRYRMIDARNAQGCPMHPKQLITELRDKILYLEDSIRFDLHSHTILRSSKRLLSQIAALMRLAPHIGTMRITIAPTLYHPDPSFFYRFRLRYAHKYRSRQKILQRIAGQDAQRIIRFIQGQGVKAARLRFTVQKTPFRLQRVGGNRPLRLKIRFSTR